MGSTHQGRASLVGMLVTEGTNDTDHSGKDVRMKAISKKGRSDVYLASVSPGKLFFFTGSKFKSTIC